MNPFTILGFSASDACCAESLILSFHHESRQYLLRFLLDSFAEKSGCKTARHIVPHPLASSMLKSVAVSEHTHESSAEHVIRIKLLTDASETFCMFIELRLLPAKNGLTLFWCAGFRD